MRFHEKWMIENRAYTCFVCWDKDGYHPERSEIPKDAQLVSVTLYAYSTILCDGFETFFESSVGDFAPEVVIALKRLGFVDAATHLQEAMVVVGGANYPRSSEDRCINSAWVKSRLDELLVTFDFAIPEPDVFYNRCDKLLLGAIKNWPLR